MIITALSDIHGKGLKTLTLPKADVACICGDIMPLNIQRKRKESIIWLVEKFILWCDNQPVDKIFFIPGNHDFIFEDIRMEFVEQGICPTGHQIMNRIYYYYNMGDVLGDVYGGCHKASLLMDEACEYNGLKFYGSPWCPDLHNWAFYGESEYIYRQFSQMSPDIDILLTHCAPKIDIYGTVLQSDVFNTMHDYGCQELADIIKEKKPKFNIFGHVHTGCHKLQKIDDTYFCNVSLLDENYNIAWVPKVFELNDHDFILQDISMWPD